jgi:hypothetical protein
MALVATFLRSQAKSLSLTALALAALGMVGYVGGRQNGFDTVVYVSTYFLLAGLVVFGLVLVVGSSMSRRPLIPRGLATIFVTFGVLTVLFPYSRLVAFPDAVLSGVAILLLVVGWKDVSDLRLWSGKPPPIHSNL